METYFKQMISQIITDVSNASNNLKLPSSKTPAQVIKGDVVTEVSQEEESEGEESEGEGEEEEEEEESDGERKK